MALVVMGMTARMAVIIRRAAIPNRVAIITASPAMCPVAASSSAAAIMMAAGMGAIATMMAAGMADRTGAPRRAAGMVAVRMAMGMAALAAGPEARVAVRGAIMAAVPAPGMAGGLVVAARVVIMAAGRKAAPMGILSSV